MGWAKYAEDNFEIYLERMDTAKQQKPEIKEQFSQVPNVKNSSFSHTSTEKSCFSLR